MIDPEHPEPGRGIVGRGDGIVGHAALLDRPCDGPFGFMMPVNAPVRGSGADRRVEPLMPFW